MYKDEDYISNLFKENEHLLEERPSTRAWDKLEAKLEAEKAFSSRKIYRYVSTAAAVIAIVVMMAAIVLFKDGDDLMAIKDTENQAIAMKKSQKKALGITDDVSDWRKEYAPDSLESALSNMEEETKPTKIIATEKPATKTVFSSNELVETKTAPLLAQATTLEEPVIEPIRNIKEVVEFEEAIESASVPAWNIAEKEVVNYSDAVAAEKSAKNRKLAETKPYSNQREGSFEKTNKINKEDKKTSLDDFQWLLGAWVDNTNAGLSYEQWTATDKNTLEAKGYLIQNKDTLYVETMQMQEILNKVYYIATFGADKIPVKYELVSYKDGVATFENKNSDFPKTIILKKENKNSFTITFQEEINPAQLRYRNNVSEARASRRMSRAGY